MIKRAFLAAAGWFGLVLSYVGIGETRIMEAVPETNQERHKRYRREFALAVKKARKKNTRLKKANKAVVGSRRFKRRRQK